MPAVFLILSNDIEAGELQQQLLDSRVPETYGSFLVLTCSFYLDNFSDSETLVFDDSPFLERDLWMRTYGTGVYA